LLQFIGHFSWSDKASKLLLKHLCIQVSQLIEDTRVNESSKNIQGSTGHSQSFTKSGNNATTVRDSVALKEAEKGMLQLTQVKQHKELGRKTFP